MKKYILFLLLFLAVLGGATAQDILSAKEIIVKDSIRIAGAWISGITPDTSLWNDIGSKIPNSKAVRDYVKKELAAVGGGVTNLTYTPSPTGGTVNSNTGTDATLTLADGTNAGLLSPAEDTKLGNTTITQPVDLDALETASHAAVTVTDNATFDFTLTGQNITGQVPDGSIGTAKITDASVAWVDLAQAVKDSIQASGEAPAIETPSAANLRDTSNFAGNTGSVGLTVDAIADRVAQREGTADAAKTNAQNRFEKTTLQPAGVLTAQNKRYSWNVRDVANARINLTSSGRLLPPISAEAGGVYVLQVSQNSTGGWQLQTDPSIYKLSGNINVNPYATTTLICNCPDGRVMNCAVSSYAPSTNQAMLSTFKNDLIFAVMPNEIGTAWVDGLGQTPKYRKAFGLGDFVGEYVDLSINAHDIAASSSPPTDPQKWHLELQNSKYCFQTDTSNFKFRDGKKIVQVHANTFTFYAWLKTAQNGPAQQMVIAAGTGAAHTGFELKKNASNQFNFRIFDGTGVVRFDITTTATLTIADNWKRVYVRSSSDADSIYVTVAGTTIGLPYTPTTISAMGSELFLCYGQSGDWWKGNVGNVFLFDRALTNAEITTLDSLPQGTLNVRGNGFIHPSATFEPEDVNGWSYSISASDSTGMYTDAAKTDLVNASGDDVYVVKSRVTTTADRDFTTDNNSRRVTYLSNQFNGKGALRFDSLDLMAFTNELTLGNLTGDFTAFYVLQVDTNQQRCIGHNQTAPFLNVSTTKTVTGGGGRIHPYQSHVRMAASTTDKFHNPYGGIASRLPTPGALCVIAVTKRDSFFEITVNNQNISTATLNWNTTFGSLFQIGGAGSFSFKGKLCELWVNQNALSNNIRDSLVKYWADFYAILNVPNRTVETYDEERTALFTPNWWEAGQEETDYRAFGETEVRGDYVWTGVKYNKHHIRRFHADGAVVLEKRNEAGTLLDTITVHRDLAAQKLDGYGGFFSFKNDSVAYVALSLIGDAYDPNWGLATDTVIPYFRTVNVNTGTLGTLTEINITGYSAITSWFLPFDFAFRGDTIYMVGYGNQNFAGDYDLLHVKSADGGSSWSIVKVWEGQADFSPDQQPEEPHYLELSDGRFGIVYRNDLNNTGIWFTSASHPNSTVWTTPVKWFDGLSFAKCIETTDRILVMIQRGDFTTYPTKVFASYDMGATWSMRGQIDLDRYSRFGFENMYGNAVEWDNGQIDAFWFAADRAQGGDFATFSKLDITALVRTATP